MCLGLGTHQPGGGEAAAAPWPQAQLKGRLCAPECAPAHTPSPDIPVRVSTHTEP